MRKMYDDLLSVVEKELVGIVGDVSAQFLIWSISKDLGKAREQLNDDDVRVLCSRLVGLLEYIIGTRGVEQLKNRVNSELSMRYAKPPDLWR